MEIITNISFGQKIPTEPLLRRALDIHNYSDSKELYYAVYTKFPGSKGCNGRANEIIQSAIEKNPFLDEIITKLKKIPNKKQQMAEIRKIKTKLGNDIDIIL